MLNLSSFRLFLFYIVLFFCFFVFQQADLFHTAISSYAYLQGHWLDFYDYNINYVQYNHYLPFIYIIFAIWNLPLYLFNLTSLPNGSNFYFERLIFPSSAIEVIWWKFLPVLFFFASVYLISLISKKLAASSLNKNIPVSTFFATSPLAVFSVFLFGGYDIVSVFFTLLGIYFYIKQDQFKFVFFFSIAISLKYFALIIFVPLLLLIEKNLFQIIKWTLLGIFFSVLQLLFYFKSQTFFSEIFAMALNKSYSDSTTKMLFKVFIFLIYLCFCIFIYLKKIANLKNFYKYVVFVPLFAYALMFIAVSWHPQWVIIICPFLSLSYMYIKQRRTLLFLEALAMIALTWFAVNNWKGNVDLSMVALGPLGSFIVKPNYLLSDFFHGFKAFFRFIFTLYLISPLLIFFYESKFEKRFESQLVSENLILIRLFLGLSPFILPAISLIISSIYV